MMLTENTRVLKQRFPHILDLLAGYDQTVPQSSIELVSTPSGMPTIALHPPDHRPAVYIHSKYNPVHEAENFINKYQDAGNYKHVIFYGVGLGYHVEALLKSQPHLSFALVEPNPAVFATFLRHKSLESLPLKRLKQIYVGELLTNDSKFVELANSLNGSVLFVVLPSYERVYESEYQFFTAQFREAVSNHVFALYANLAFEKQWTVNSLMNLPETMQSANIFHFDRSLFQGKPAVIVAAGPSLEEEIEHLRKIKNEGLGYIFSVGSAIKALLANGIYPDAACAYDPLSPSLQVFEEMSHRDITTIPLIYGTSIYFRILKQYPGPKLHMVMEQDTVSPFFLKRVNDVRNSAESPPIVTDAPSIAVVTLELLHKLGCNPIVLVGQNLAYRDKQFYTGSIGNTRLEDWQLSNALKIKDVYGEEIYTDIKFNQMRKDIEYIIENFGIKDVINTTKGGAHIEGTTFVHLDEIIKEQLQSRVIKEEPFKVMELCYDMSEYQNQVEKMQREHQALLHIFDTLTHILKRMEANLNTRKVEVLQPIIYKFNQVLITMEQNQFYQVFLRPMGRTQHEFLVKAMNEIRYEKALRVQAKKMIEHHGKLLSGCREDMALIQPIFAEIHQEITHSIERSKQEVVQ